MKNIFISSTFRDMHAERDMVMQDVLPDLKIEAKKYGDNVNAIDLRWGVDTSDKEEEESGKKVLSVCFDEIDKSRPYMLVFLGNRYGWIPDIDIVNKSIRGREDKFTSDVISKSVTALEIEYGALSNNIDDVDRTIICFRDLNLDLLNESDIKIFEEEDREKIERLKDLKERILDRYGDRVIFYEASYNNGKLYDFRTKDNRPLSDVIIERFLDLFKSEWMQYNDYSWQEREWLEAKSLMEKKRKGFAGREELINQYFNKLNGAKYLLVQGESGCGKTSILSLLYKKVEDEVKKSEGIDNSEERIFRFICANGSRSCEAEDLLKQMVYFLEKRLNINHDEANRDYIDWKIRFEDLLDLVPDNQHEYFFIDAVDQLTKDSHTKSMDYIPLNRKNIHFFVTSTYDLSYDEIDIDIKDRLTRVTLGKLSTTEAEDVIRGIMSSDVRDIYPGMIEIMLNKNNIYNPLYISLLVQRLNMMNEDELKVTSNNEDIKEKCNEIIRSFPETIYEAVQSIIDACIERIDEKSDESFWYTLGLLANSRRGLREEDLIDIFDEREEEFNRLDFTRFRKYLNEFFIEREDGCIDFTHREIRNGILKKYNISQNDEFKVLIAQRLFMLDENDLLRSREGVYASKESDDYGLLYCLLEDVYNSKHYKNELSEKNKDLINYGIKELFIEDKGEFIERFIKEQLKEIYDMKKDSFAYEDDRSEEVILEYFLDFEEKFDISREILDAKIKVFFAIGSFLDEIKERTVSEEYYLLHYEALYSCGILFDMQLIQDVCSLIAGYLIDYNQCITSEMKLTLYKDLVYAGNALYSRNDYEGTIDVCGLMYDLIEKIENGNQTLEMLVIMSKITCMYGKALASIGYQIKQNKPEQRKVFKKALDLLDISIETLELIKDTDSSVEILKYLSHSNFSISEINWKMFSSANSKIKALKYITRARENGDKGLGYAKGWYEKSRTNEALIYYVNSIRHNGLLYAAEKEYEKAKAEYENALEWIDKLILRVGEGGLLGIKGQCYQCLGDMYIQMSEENENERSSLVKKAQDMYKMFLRIKNNECKEKVIAENYNKVAEAYEYVGMKLSTDEYDEIVIINYEELLKIEFREEVFYSLMRLYGLGLENSLGRKKEEYKKKLDLLIGLYEKETGKPFVYNQLDFIRRFSN